MTKTILQKYKDRIANSELIKEKFDLLDQIKEIKSF